MREVMSQKSFLLNCRNRSCAEKGQPNRVVLQKNTTVSQFLPIWKNSDLKMNELFAAVGLNNRQSRGHFTSCSPNVNFHPTYSTETEIEIETRLRNSVCIDQLMIPQVRWPIPNPMYTDTFSSCLQTRPNLLSWLVFIVRRLFPEHGKWPA